MISSQMCHSTIQTLMALIISPTSRSSEPWWHNGLTLLTEGGLVVQWLGRWTGNQQVATSISSPVLPG